MHILRCYNSILFFRNFYSTACWWGQIILTILATVSRDFFVSDDVSCRISRYLNRIIVHSFSFPRDSTFVAYPWREKEDVYGLCSSSRELVSLLLIALAPTRSAIRFSPRELSSLVSFYVEIYESSTPFTLQCSREWLYELGIIIVT